MALKDWKKTRHKSNSQGWKNKKTGKNILFLQFMSDNYWSFIQEGKTIKNFKTKSKALAYAKSYMRKH